MDIENWYNKEAKPSLMSSYFISVNAVFFLLRLLAAQSAFWFNKLFAKKIENATTLYVIASFAQFN